MTSGTNLKGGIAIPSCECKVCAFGMVVNRQPNPQCVLLECRGLVAGKPCGTTVLICTSQKAEARYVTFWSMDCSSGSNLVAYARVQLGKNATLYGFSISSVQSAADQQTAEVVNLADARCRLRVT